MSAAPTHLPACAARPELFWNPALEDASAHDPAARRLLAEASAVCAGCPIAQRCLYDAVARHDVAGFVAGTTEAQRRRLRARLGVRIAAENLDAAAGVPLGGRPIDRTEVVRLRVANPDETLDQLAMRLGCSMSTVKRHLRKVRNGVPVRRTEVGARVTIEQVWAAAAALLRPRPVLDAA